MSDEPDDKKTTVTDADEMAEKIARLLDKHSGKPDDAVRELLRDNFKARDGRRADRERYERELAELRAKLPSDGAVVLTRDEAASVKQYESLGGMETLKERLARLDELEKRDAERTWSDRARQIAERAGYDPDVFAGLLRMPDAPKIEAFEDEKDGANWRIRVVGEGGKEPLGRFAEKVWAKFLPALKAAGGKGKPESVVQRSAERTASEDIAVRRLASL